MLSSLEKVKTALIGISERVYHFEALDAEAPYIVWAEDNEFNSLAVDEYKAFQAIEGTIDLYTKGSDDSLIESIPRALNGAGITWVLNSVQYEDDTELIHHEWLFRVRQSWEEESQSQGSTS